MSRPDLTPEHAVAGYSFGVRPRRPTDEEFAEHNRLCRGCDLCAPWPTPIDIGDGPPPGT